MGGSPAGIGRSVRPARARRIPRCAGAEAMTPRTRHDPLTRPERTRGLYAEHVVPRLVNLACGTKTAEPLRQRVCDGLVGNVGRGRFRIRAERPVLPIGRDRRGRCRAVRLRLEARGQTAARNAYPCETVGAGRADAAL